MKRDAARPYFRALYEKNRWNLALALLFSVFVSAEYMVESWLLGVVLDTITTGDLGRLLRYVGVTAALVPLCLLVDLSMFRFKSRFIHRGLCQYKTLAFQRLSEKSISAFANESTGRYLSALTNDAHSIEENYLGRTTGLVISCLQFVLALGMMLWYSRVMTATVVVLSLLPVLVSLVMGKGLTRRERQVSEENETFTARLKDLLGGFSVIKSFKAEEQAQRLFDGANADLERAKEKRRWYASILNALSLSAGSVLQFGIFLIGAWLAIRGQITAGTVIVFVNLCNFVLQPIQNVPEYWASRKAAEGLVEKLAELTEEHTRRGGVAVEGSLTQGFQAKELSFGYGEGEPILRDLTFSFEPGKSYAIVGASGSGKTTLLNLLMGAYDSYSGSLTVDGRELREVDTDSLYELISFVGQNVFLFDDTIRQNMTMFRTFPDEAVRSAMERAGLNEVVAARGEDYRCGENGAKLSGGERQRIAIARSLLRGARVLLVDEATAALDAETANQVAGAILDLEDMTRIVVTHRLEPSLLRRYDSILMLKNGAICEQGRFEELMDAKGQFYSLYTVTR